MAAKQAEAVHQGIAYDLQIDTSSAPPEALAKIIRERFGLTSW